METGKPEPPHEPRPRASRQGPDEVARRQGMHYIRTADGLEELYMLNSDPEERFNVAGSPNAQAVLEQFRRTLGLMLKKR